VAAHAEHSGALHHKGTALRVEGLLQGGTPKIEKRVTFASSVPLTLHYRPVIFEKSSEFRNSFRDWQKKLLEVLTRRGVPSF
jgi:hypothetical protein